MCYKVWRDGKFVEISTPDELAQSIKNTLSFYKERMEAAEGRANKTREEVDAEVRNEYAKEIEHLKRKLCFSIADVSSEKERKAYDEFVAEHMPCRMTKATGGKMPQIQQTGTGIGTVTILRCPVCGEEKNITDTNAW